MVASDKELNVLQRQWEYLVWFEKHIERLIKIDKIQKKLNDK